MEIVNENHENRFWFCLEQLGHLPKLFNNATGGTPFEGSKLRFTGNRNRRLRLYEFELLATTNMYQDIPGHTLVGFAKTEDGGETYHVHRLANIDWTRELVDSLDPLRCDVCGHRRQRKQQFLVRQNDTGKLLVVGGSCSKKIL